MFLCFGLYGAFGKGSSIDEVVNKIFGASPHAVLGPRKYHRSGEFRQSFEVCDLSCSCLRALHMLLLSGAPQDTFGYAVWGYKLQRNAAKYSYGLSKTGYSTWLTIPEECIWDHPPDG